MQYLRPHFRPGRVPESAFQQDHPVIQVHFWSLRSAIEAIRIWEIASWLWSTKRFKDGSPEEEVTFERGREWDGTNGPERSSWLTLRRWETWNSLETTPCAGRNQRLRPHHYAAEERLLLKSSGPKNVVELNPNNQRMNHHRLWPRQLQAPPPASAPCWWMGMELGETRQTLWGYELGLP